IDRKVISNEESYAINNPYFGMQLAYLKGMVEQNKAVKNANGFTILTEDVIGLGDDFISLFEFPAFYQGSYQTRFEGSTGQSAFSAPLALALPDGDVVSRFTVFGPFLKLAENEMYLLQTADWIALKALLHHQHLSGEHRGE